MTIETRSHEEAPKPKFKEGNKIRWSGDPEDIYVFGGIARNTPDVKTRLYRILKVGEGGRVVWETYVGEDEIEPITMEEGGKDEKLWREKFHPQK